MPIGAEASFVGVIDLFENKALVWSDDDRRRQETGEIPPDLQGRGGGDARPDGRADRRDRRGSDAQVPRRQGDQRRRTAGRPAPGDHHRQGHAGPVRLVAAQQGRAADARRGDRLPALAADIADVTGTQARTRTSPRRRPREATKRRSAPWCSRSSPTPTSGGWPTSESTSGKITQGSMVYNSTKGKRERVGRLIRMYADRREDLPEILAGDIAAVLGMKDTFTGDTLCDSGQPDRARDDLTSPSRSSSWRSSRRTKADQSQMGDALQKLSEEDPTFRVEQRREHGSDRDLGHGRAAPGSAGRPDAARVQGPGQRRPAAGRLSRVDHRARGQVRLPLRQADRRPRPVRARGPVARAGGPGSGIDLREPHHRAAPSHTSTSRRVEKGVREAAEGGVLAGYPIVDIKVKPDRRLVPRSRLERDGLQDGRLDGVQAGRADGPPGAARADDARRGPSPRTSSWAR